jgi:hypothetical protein
MRYEEGGFEGQQNKAMFRKDHKSRGAEVLRKEKIQKMKH